MSGARLPIGGRIDRGKPLRFTLDGRGYQGFAGDTLASALLASRVSLVGRSFKYHRPRGIMGQGAEDPSALAQLGTGGDTEPNLRATQVELYDGLVASSVNRWPSLGFDLGAVNGLLALRFPAGHLNNIHQQASAEEHTMRQFLEFKVDCFNQFLAVDGNTQERFKSGQKRLSFFEGKRSVGHRSV